MKRVRPRASNRADPSQIEPRSTRGIRETSSRDQGTNPESSPDLIGTLTQIRTYSTHSTRYYIPIAHRARQDTRLLQLR